MTSSSPRIGSQGLPLFQWAETLGRLSACAVPGFPLATQSGALGLGDKQAVARKEGWEHLFRWDFSRPLTRLGVVRFRRGVLAAA